MDLTDYSFIDQKLIDFGYSDDDKNNTAVRKAVLELFHTLDAQNLADNDYRETVVDLFSFLANEDEVRKTERISSPASWKQFHLGDYPVGAILRVKPDAYTSVPGKRHNGLVGTLVAGRGGRAVIQYIGRLDGVGHYHHPDNLEALVRG